MLEISSEIIKLSKLHPWIVATYQFMLKTAEFADLVYKNNEIVPLFPIDSALFRYVDGILERRLYAMVGTSEMELCLKIFLSVEIC